MIIKNKYNKYIIFIINTKYNNEDSFEKIIQKNLVQKWECSQKTSMNNL